MIPSQRRAALLVLLITLLMLTALLAPLALAQTATPPATAAAVTGTPTLIGTPTPTLTPTLTPTPTPTLTALGAKLVLAQTYLAGKDYGRAAALFAEVSQEDRGNAEALAGLKEALDGQAAAEAAALPSTPAPEPTAVPPAPAPRETLVSTLGAKLRDFAGTALAALLVVVLVYLLANAFRWALQTLRELWFTRGLPLIKRPAVQPGFLVGEFTNTLGETGDNAARIVPLALTEKLIRWNQLVQAKEVPVEPEPKLDLGGMGWLKILWGWILPPPRGYKVTGALLRGATGTYLLTVQRQALSSNSIDRSTTLEQRGATADDAFRKMAGEAAKWLVNPGDIEASQAIVRGMKATKDVGDAMQLTPSEVFDQALELLLPVRQQVAANAIDFADARNRLRSAESLLGQLPSGSGLRQDLQTVIADLRRSVPAG